ncbi:MAG: Pr6Pr family membrane protein [Nocardioides sp.]|nr:Pr6Pr family membrane protein [Nocardioides sp.]
MLQLVLVVQGSAVLVDTDPPGPGERVYRFFAYFTIQSNLLVLLITAVLARSPAYDGPRWRVLRLAAVAGITVTGLVHFFLLRPLLDLDGPDRVADTLLHLVVPALALLGWLVLGPRPRVTRRAVGLSLLWPVTWLVWTLVAAQVTGWYPYPFLDPAPDGAGPVVVACVGVTVLFLVVLGLFAWLDRRLSPASG